MIRQLAYFYALTDKLQEFCVELVLVQLKAMHHQYQYSLSESIFHL